MKLIPSLILLMTVLLGFVVSECVDNYVYSNLFIAEHARPQKIILDNYRDQKVTGEKNDAAFSNHQAENYPPLEREKFNWNLRHLNLVFNSTYLTAKTLFIKWLLAKEWNHKPKVFDSKSKSKEIIFLKEKGKNL